MCFPDFIPGTPQGLGASPPPDSIPPRAPASQAHPKSSPATPIEYLTDWRLALAQTLLEKRRPIKSIAGSVAYRSPAALTRAFKRRLGQAPTDWMASRAIADSVKDGSSVNFI
ncbi:MAG: helix-turn-helix domain-containing protein [Betaproteobacteria bacterium]